MGDRREFLKAVGIGMHVVSIVGMEDYPVEVLEMLVKADAYMLERFGSEWRDANPEVWGRVK